MVAQASRRVVLNVADESGPVGVLVKPRAICVSVGDAEVFTFDLSGRLYSGFDRGHHFRRGFDGRILEAWRERRGDRDALCERWLTESEAETLLANIHRRVGRMADTSRNGVHAALNRVSAWTPEAYLADANRFRLIYRPVSILPPDQYLAVMVQASEGCAWNRCRFCDFYRDRAFRIRTPDELADHIQDVRGFLGDGLAMRRSIFLGDANALSIPFADLRSAFDAIRQGFPEGDMGPSWRNVYGFVDAWGGQKRTEDQIAELRSLGLCRAYVGLETGHDELLVRVGKRGTGGIAIDVVNRFKSAGVNVGVIVLLGLGGKRYAQEHVWDTVRVLNEMNLGSGDLIYFSQLIISSYLPYARDMWAAGIESLDQEEMAQQEQLITGGLEFKGGFSPKLARYDIRRFVY